MLDGIARRIPERPAAKLKLLKIAPCSRLGARAKGQP